MAEMVAIIAGVSLNWNAWPETEGFPMMDSRKADEPNKINAEYAPDLQSNLVTNTVYLCIHILFAYFYCHIHTPILFYYNLFSIAVFTAQYAILMRKKFLLFIMVCYVEIAAFTMINLICLGWEYGFQLYCFGFIVTTLFIDFFTNDGSKIRPRTWIILGIDVVLYIGTRLWLYENAPVYELSNRHISHMFYICNTIFSFTVQLAFTTAFINTVYRLQKELQTEALHDPLTGLYNRRRLEEILSERIDSEQLAAEFYAIGMMDIDFFKNVNDSYGHGAGDKVLLQIAEIFKEKEKEDPAFVAARIGGEEFVLLYHGPSEAAVRDFYIQMQKEIGNQSIVYGEKKISVTVTIGVAFSYKGLTQDQMWKNADRLLYLGKASGRNQVVF